MLATADTRRKSSRHGSRPPHAHAYLTEPSVLPRISHQEAKLASAKTVYDEFGVVLSDTNPAFQPFGFAGGLYDPDTGLVRFGARDYEAVTSRWTARDPVGVDADGSNLYSYGDGDPVNYLDASGLKAIDCRFKPCAADQEKQYDKCLTASKCEYHYEHCTAYKSQTLCNKEFCVCVGKCVLLVPCSPSKGAKPVGGKGCGIP